MRVLSLFDGMSCGQIALNKLGYKNITYHASEIDKYAMSITQKNFPDTIQVGDVLKLKSEDFTDIDLMLAGSPCQGFSFAGKQLAFDDPRSRLFFEFVRLLKEIKPKYFLLENVRMKKEFLSIISEQVGVEPTLINSSKLSAQSRQRYYWTNIPFNKNIEDKGIVLKDILETNTDNKYNLSEEKKDRVLNAKRGKGYFYNRDSEKIGTVMALYHKDPTDGSYIEDHKPVKQTERNRRHLRRDDQKSLCMTATMWKGAGNNGMTLVETKPKQVGTAADINGHDLLKRVYSPEGKSPTLNAHGGGNTEPKVVVNSYKERRTEEGKAIRREIKKLTGKDHTPFRSKELIERNDGKVSTLTPALNNEHKLSLTRDKDEEVYWRKLTPLECERLQTVPDNYTEGVSNTQRYKMIGNGWTVDVIAHILKHM